MAFESGNAEVSDRGLFGSGKEGEAKNEEEDLVAGVESQKVDESPVEEKEEEKKESSLSSSDEEEEVAPDDGEIKKKTFTEKIKEKLGEVTNDETAPTPNPVAVAPVAPAHLGEDEKDETVLAPNPLAVAPVAPANLVEDEKKETAVAPDPVAAAPVAPAHVDEDETAPARAANPLAAAPVEGDNANYVKVEPGKEGEKKGFIDKIMDILPGHGDEKKAAAPAPTPLPVSTSTEEDGK